MKLAVSCVCILHLAFISAELFPRNDLNADRNHLSSGRVRASHATGSVRHIRQRPLFARRGQYERQRVHVPKSKEVPVPPSKPSTPSKATPRPGQPNCSHLQQSCLPQSGCCDPRASCHCRFFNAICFCRKTNPLHNQKT